MKSSVQVETEQAKRWGTATLHGSAIDYDRISLLALPSLSRLPRPVIRVRTLAQLGFAKTVRHL